MTQQDRTAVQYHKMTETPIPRHCIFTRGVEVENSSC